MTGGQRYKTVQHANWSKAMDLRGMSNIGQQDSVTVSLLYWVLYNSETVTLSKQDFDLQILEKLVLCDKWINGFQLILKSVYCVKYF